MCTQLREYLIGVVEILQNVMAQNDIKPLIPNSLLQMTNIGLNIRELFIEVCFGSFTLGMFQHLDRVIEQSDGMALLC